MNKKSQTDLENAKVIRRFGNWTVESYKGPNGEYQLAVSNGWLVRYPIIYDSGKIGWDYLDVPDSVSDYVRDNSLRLNRKLRLRDKND